MCVCVTVYVFWVCVLGRMCSPACDLRPVIALGYLDLKNINFKNIIFVYVHFSSFLSGGGELLKQNDVNRVCFSCSMFLRLNLLNYHFKHFFYGFSCQLFYQGLRNDTSFNQPCTPALLCTMFIVISWLFLMYVLSNWVNKCFPLMFFQNMIIIWNYMDNYGITWITMELHELH